MGSCCRHRKQTGRIFAGLVLLGSAVIWVAPAAGLDPSKRLSQYGLRTWGLHEGLPKTPSMPWPRMPRAICGPGPWVAASGVESTEDSGQCLWARTGGGLVEIDSEFEIVVHGPEKGLPHPNVMGLAEDRAGAPLVATADGVARLRGATAGRRSSPVVV